MACKCLDGCNSLSYISDKRRDKYQFGGPSLSRNRKDKEDGILSPPQSPETPLCCSAPAICACARNFGFLLCFSLHGCHLLFMIAWNWKVDSLGLSSCSLSYSLFKKQLAYPLKFSVSLSVKRVQW